MRTSRTFRPDRRRLASLGTLLVWGLAAGPGIGGAQSNPAIQTAVKRENALNQKNLMELNKAEIDAKAQEDIGLRNCRDDQGCKKRVVEDYLAKVREINNQRTLEGARHAKALIDIQEGALDEEGQGYLKGRVVQEEGTPPEAPSGPLIDLSNALNELAPHYDMTRPHEGLRIIGDIVTGMGLGYLAKGLGFAMKGAVGRLTGKAMQEAAEVATESAPRPSSWAPPGATAEPPAGAGGRVTTGPATSGRPTGGGGAASGTGTPGQIPGGGPTGGSLPPGAVVPPRTLPPGVQVPDVLRNTPRPLYLQQTPSSCGQACIKMVSETVQRRSLPESFYRQLSRGGLGANPGGYAPGVGTQMGNLAQVMQKAGIRATVLSGQTVDDIAAATRNGYPAIARVGTDTAGHFVVVDGVVGSPGNRYLLLRDPLNLAHTPDAATRQLLVDSGFSNMPVVSEQDFVNTFGGWALFVRP